MLASYTFTTGDAGAHTFLNVVLKTAGSETISATDSVRPLYLRHQPPVDVVPAAVKDFVVTTSFGSPDVAGTVGTVTVTAKDAYGNTVGSGANEYEGTVILKSTDGQAVGVPASHAFTLTDAGTYAFMGVILKTAGAQTITATESVSPGMVGTDVVTVVATARRGAGGDNAAAQPGDRRPGLHDRRVGRGPIPQCRYKLSRERDDFIAGPPRRTCKPETAWLRSPGFRSRWSASSAASRRRRATWAPSRPARSR